jgi:hypothetical protein
MTEVAGAGEAAEALSRPRPRRELDTVAGQHGVAPVGHGFHHIEPESLRDGGVGLPMHSTKANFDVRLIVTNLAAGAFSGPAKKNAPSNPG